MITCILPNVWLLHFSALGFNIFFFGRSPNAVMQHCQFLYLRHTEEAFRLRRLKQWQYAVKNPRCVAGIGAIVFRRRGQIKIQVVAEDAVKQEKWNEHYPHLPFFGFAIFCVCAFFLLCFNWQIHQTFWFSLSSVFSFLHFLLFFFPRSISTRGLDERGPEFLTCALFALG